MIGAKMPRTLPSAWTLTADFGRRLAGKRLALFLDFDGTLAPIVDDPDRAAMDADTRAAVETLSALVDVAIISGRDLADVRARVNLDAVFLAGSHGFDIAGPKGRDRSLQQGTEFLPRLGDAESRLRERLAAVPGAAVERTNFSISVHYRRVPVDMIGRVEDIVGDVMAETGGLKKDRGKKVFQIGPDVDWHKGKALSWILHSLGYNRDDVMPIFIGDDVTDETAFRHIRGWGIGIVVGDEDRPTAAAYALSCPSEVTRFLRMLIGVT
jgi:trehalose 6-phosphate phosphatase